MKRLFKMSALLMLILGIQAANSQHVVYQDSWGKQGITLQNQDGNTLSIDFSLTSFIFEENEIDGQTMKSIKTPGIFLPNNEGAPDLPGTGRYIAIPQNATASYRVIASKTEVYKNIDIAPAPRIPLDTDDGPLQYKANEKIYNKNEYYPKSIVTLSETKQLRGVDVVMFGITPFQYNPVTKELIIYRDVKIEIEHKGGNGIVGDERLRSRWWDAIINDAVLNSDAIPKVDYSKIQSNKDTPDYEYLIITPDDPTFISWADSIKLFRTLQGINTGVVTTTDVGGNTVSAIENYVDNAYNTWDTPPSAVLLLGDYGTGTSGIISQFYTHPASYPDFVSDNRYADVDGDELPEIAFARITANNAAELEVMITKFLDYERNPPTSPDFYDHPITALGWQTERWFQICSEAVGGYFRNNLGKNPVRINAVYSGTPGTDWSTATNTATVVDYFGPSGLGYLTATPAELGGWTGGTATDVVNAINAGSFMLQHRDHGSYTGWGEPSFQSTNINSLNNVDNKLPYIFSINCQTGAFHRSTETFTEKFHRHTFNGQNSGALGVMAATEVSYSFVNDTYLWGVMDNMFPDFMPSETTTFPVNYVMPAFSNASGKHFLYQSGWPYNTSDKLITYRLFHHHGDAFMTLYTEVPQNLTVVHNAALIGGLSSFTVTADVGSLIALTVNGEILGTADGTGSPVVINIPSQDPGNTMVVTVTKQNYYRYSSNVEILPPSGPFVAYLNHAINDATGNYNGEVDYGENILLDITLENLGNDPAYNVSATLICSDPNITITDNTELYGTIAANGTSNINNGFSFTVSDDILDQHELIFEVAISGNADDIWTSYFSITVNAPLLEFGSLSIDDDIGGDGNGRLDPGETAEITIPVLNNGNSSAPTALASLTSGSVWITINTGAVTLGVLNSGGSNDAVFNISCDPLTPIGTPVDLLVDVTSGNYGINNTFYAPVGLVLEDWETGNFGSFPWTFDGTANWIITDIDPYEGTYCTKSGTITHNQTSELVIDVYVSSADNISFYRKVSSENTFDYLQFYIDGTQQEQWSGEEAWSQVSYPVTTGAHTFKWVYEKDGSVDGGSDCGWVDYIIFPPITPPPDPAEIALSPLSFEVTLAPDGSTVEQLNIANTGEEDLSFSLIKSYLSKNKSTKAYCTSVGGGDDEFISNVTIGTINNSTAQDYYADYTTMSTVVNASESYPITITNGDPNWSTDQCGIWVDWNQNEDFTDDGVITVSGTPGVGPYTANIVPPVDALGGPTRMRVQIIYSATPDPCTASFSYGEVEDYTLIVNSNFTDWLTFDATMGTVIGSDNMDIDLTFVATDMELGDYYANITINSNDPLNPQMIVPCTLHVVEGITLDAKVYLQGAFFGTDMNTALNTLGYLPLSQPYNTTPWNYPGTELVTSIPNSDVIDWLLLELRETSGGASTANGSATVARRAALLLRDGSIVDIDGVSPLMFNVEITQNLYAVVYHRNHTSIMSANALQFNGSSYGYDFSFGPGQVYGGQSAHTFITVGVWGMISGDVNGDGEIDNKDKDDVWLLQRGMSGYYPGDFNMNGTVQDYDINTFWDVNAGKCSMIVK